MALPGQVSIVEVGPRDGLQNEPVMLDADSRIQFIRRLGECGLTRIEAGSFVSSRQIPQMADTDEVIKNLDLESDIRYPVLVPNLKGLESALACSVKEIAIFAAASETFSQKNINCGIEESIERYTGIAKTAAARGIKIRGYISCVMGCPYEGEIEPGRVSLIAERLMEMGCYEVSLGDTIGIGTPLLSRRLIDFASKNIDKNRIAVHFHDTYGRALANIYAALEMGITIIDSSAAGLGGCPYADGASGNVATEDVVDMLDALGIEHGVNLKKLIQAGREICEKLERPVMSKVNLAAGDR